MHRRHTILILLPLVLLGGCASFQREWRAALENPHEGIEGPWTGTWTSGFNAHTGILRCVVTHKQDDQFEMHYYARWGPILSASFRSVYTVRKDGDTFSFSGEKDLRPWGGVFRFTGTASETEFKADYTSDGSDFGTFEMTRPPG